MNDIIRLIVKTLQQSRLTIIIHEYHTLYTTSPWAGVRCKNSYWVINFRDVVMPHSSIRQFKKRILIGVGVQCPKNY